MIASICRALGIRRKLRRLTMADLQVENEKLRSKITDKERQNVSLHMRLGAAQAELDKLRKLVSRRDPVTGRWTKRELR